MQALLPDLNPAIDTLMDDIDAARAESYPLLMSMRLLGREPSGDPTAIADALVIEEGYKGLGAHWVEVPRRIAAKIVTHLIAGELAYPNEIVEQGAAEALTSRFLGFFPQGARYFTNGACSGPFAVYNLVGEEVLGWRSLSEAPFDNGVVVISAERAGMIWAEDAP